MLNPIISEEFAHAIHGVQGRMFARTIGGKNYKENTFTSQKWATSREYRDHGAKLRMRVKIRFDDECRNGHNSFSIVCDIDEWRAGAWREFGGGAAHDKIAKVFPELKPLIKWHLTSSDGPMHYIANTLYHASDRDYNGKRAGEPCAWDSAVQFGDNPIKHKISDKFSTFLQEASNTALHGAAFDFEVIEIAERKESLGKVEYYRGYTFGGYAAKWYECPFKTESAALDFLKALQTCNPTFVKIPTLFSDGKQRDLDAARRAAIWPEATDEQLSLPREELKALLEARQERLMSEFKNDIEECGFMWSPSA